MIHPFMPFVTEEIWSTIGDTHLSPGTGVCPQPFKNPLCLQNWDKVAKKAISLSAEKDMQALIDLIVSIRNVRAQWNIGPQQKIECFLTTDTSNLKELLKNSSGMIQSLGRLEKITIENKSSQTKNIASGIVNNIKFAIPLGNIIDIEKEKKRIATLIEENDRASNGISQRLKNKGFVDKAPKEVVEKDRERLKTLKTKTEELKIIISTLQ